MNYNFNINNIGVFDYRFLMNNPEIEFDDKIVARYKDITSKLNFNNVKDKSLYTYNAVYEQAKKDIIGNDDVQIVVDNIILSIFYRNKTKKKKAFWTLFGDIVYNNLCSNLSENYAYCERCHKRFYKGRSTQKYCSKCQGYQKLNVKTIVCCDCGKEFEVDGIVKNKKRCYECQHEIDRLNNLKRVKKFLDNHKN